MKDFWRSKTILVQILSMIAVSTLPAIEEYVRLHPAISIVMFAISNVILRLLTKEPIKALGKTSTVPCVLFGSLLFLTSCSSVTQSLSAEDFYKRDMLIEYQGEKHEGFVVLPKKPTYHFTFYGKGPFDLFTLTTCHREITVEKIRGGIFNKIASEYEMDFTPIEGIETKDCPVFVGGYDEQHGRHSWGIIDFQDPTMDLDAHVLCNGEKREYKGVSICQSKEGLIQQISFDEKVKTSFVGGVCDMKSQDGKTFMFEMPKGQCAFVFMGELTGQMHRLTTLGYEKIVVRGK